MNEELKRLHQFLQRLSWALRYFGTGWAALDTAAELGLIPEGQFSILVSTEKGPRWIEHKAGRPLLGKDA